MSRHLPICLTIAAALAMPNPAGGQDTKSYPYVESAPSRTTHIYHSEKNGKVGIEFEYRLLCGSNSRDLTPKAIEDYITKARSILMDEPRNGRRVRGTGLDIVFDTDASVPAAAITAIADVEAYLEDLFEDDATFTMVIRFDSLGAGILGQAGSSLAVPTYDTVRTALVGDMDGDDQLQTALPPCCDVPVRYDANSANVTLKDRCHLTVANYRATIGTIGGNAATITFNTGFPWDYDPSNGVGSGLYDFRSVLVHEVGHAMGFVSATDWNNGALTLMDVFRFQGSDGGGDYNPDTIAEFTTTARLVHDNTPNNDHVTDLIDVVYAMSDGSPSQASHFSTSEFAIMDPNMAAGESFYPNYLRMPDLTVLDAMGWDYAPNGPDVAPPSPDPMSFAANPSGLNTLATTMVATLAMDVATPVSYFFESVSGDSGASSSTWQTSRSYVDSGLTPNAEYTYRVQARDALGNTTQPSTAVATWTLARTPGVPSITVLSDTTMLLAINVNGNPATTEFAARCTASSPPDSAWVGRYQQADGTPAVTPAWQTAAGWATTTMSGLTPGTNYTIVVQARNGQAVLTPFGPSGSATTQACSSDAECDDGSFCNGTESCDGDGRCQTAAAPCADPALCDEAKDECDECDDDADCDDALFCNGTESCDPDGQCQSAAAPCADPALCDEANDECDECDDDADCDDALFCNGTESCDADGHCLTAAAPCADPGLCDEANDECDECDDDADCDDTLFCNGTESCDSDGHCQNAAAPCADPALCDEANDECDECNYDADCDDTLFCNGTESCDPDGQCRSAAAPCADPALCDEANDECDECDDDADCGDALFCNGTESCDADGQCQAGTDPCGTEQACDEPSDSCFDCVADADCDDGAFCNGTERCDEVGQCTAGISPCTVPALCDELNNECDDCSVNADCDDGVFCNGHETCDADGQCQAGSQPCAEPALCDEINGACDECDDDADCDDGAFCNGHETCSDGTCRTGLAPCASACDEVADVCMNCATNADCDDGVFCNGHETCDADGACVAGTAPCFAAVLCNETDDQCDRCSSHAECDDGAFCNGAEQCAADGSCAAGSPPCPPDQLCDEASDSCQSNGGGTPPGGGGGTVTGGGSTPDPEEPEEPQDMPPPGEDEDSDGVPDEDDQCPGTPAGDPANSDGCSASQVEDDGFGAASVIDEDEDGIVDGRDQCADTPGAEIADASGCSPSQLDTDVDSVSDATDLCDNTMADIAVDEYGCATSQLDSDADGVTDDRDACPDTQFKRAVDRRGCAHIFRPEFSNPTDSPEDGSFSPAGGESTGTTAQTCGCGAGGPPLGLVMMLSLQCLRRRRRL